MSVSQVARRYDVNANLVFKWLRDPRFARGEEGCPFLPVEVIPFAAAFVQSRIAALGREPVLRCTDIGTTFRTYENNVILDCPFGRIDDPESLAAELSLIPGVVEHGLFLGMIDEMLFG